MLQLTYPGVYVQEIPSGTHTISGVATSTTAFVGYLTRGPLNTPVQCLNFGDFQRVFGGLDQNSITSFQVSQFFLNGGTEAWVSRLCASSAPPVQPAATLIGANPPATPTPPPSGAPAQTKGVNILPLQSQNPGTWGQNIFVTVDYMTNKLNTFNLTATLYSTTSNSNSTSTSYSVVQTQSVPGVTLDIAQANSIIEVMQSSSNQYSQLLAIPNITATPSVLVPFASGTVLTFTPPKSPVSGVTFTITVEPPPVGGKPAPPLTAAFSMAFTVATVADLIAGIQGALSNAAGVLGIPSLASATVRSCLSPYPPAAGQPQAQLVQVWSPDPGLAQYLIGVTSTQTSLFSTLQTNYQAQQLTCKSQNNPDGLIPTGFDVAGNSVTRTGIYALDAMQLVNLLLVPDMPAMGPSDYLTAATATLNYAIQRKAFAILDMPNGVQSPSDAVAWATANPGTFGTGIISAATYFPQLLVPNPFSTQPLQIGGSGTLAGIYALTDQTRGVWKAPAGISAPLAGAQQLSYVMNDPENGQINPLGINALRTFPIYDNISWGARTLAAANIADEDWKYVPVRRLALYIEQSLIQGLQWVVFEPNDDRLWAQIRLSVNSFMHPLYLQGAFVGASPSQAYQCICDASTTTAEDMENGIVNILILFAPVRPAEFVVISLQQMAGQSSS
ncbi:phage tail sheath family protein [Sphingomonas sp. DT-207]|uniref:phage tail sheath family protein n=1 Tax=Sphingomonas sp. DT-207 TaxID=3396167 RepID=UPI003F54066D